MPPPWVLKAFSWVLSTSQLSPGECLVYSGNSLLICENISSINILGYKFRCILLKLNFCFKYFITTQQHN